jgi:hypothetical protein
MASTSELEIELKVFEENRGEWSRAHPGKFVVIQNNEVLDDFYSDYAEAFKAGLRKFGVSRHFLIKQVWISEPVYFVA